MSSGTNQMRADLLLERQKSWDLLRFPTRAPAASVLSVRLAWPVYGWRVIAPRPADENTNAIERAVLRLCSIGSSNPGEAGILLGIPAALVRTVQRSLIDRKYLNERLEVQEIGKAILVGNEPDEVDTNSEELGWIFRDALSGDVLPMFVRGSLPLAPAAAAKEVYLLPYGDEFSTRPSSLSILTGLRLYGRVSRFESETTDSSGLSANSFDPEQLRFMEWGNVADVGGTVSAESALSPDFVRVLNSKAEALDLETPLYITGDDFNDWHIRSPFGTAGGWWFKKKLEWGIAHSPVLEYQIESWLKSARDTILARYPEFPIAGDESRILMALFPTLVGNPRFDHVNRELAGALRSESLFRVDNNNLDVVLNRYQKALEALLTLCIEAVPAREDLARKIGSQDFANKAQVMAQALSVHMPASFSRASNGHKMVAVARYGGAALRDRALFLLGHAYYESGSPFRSVLIDQPDLLVLLDEVAERRNRQGAHFSDSISSEEPEDIFNAVRDASHRIIHAITKHYS